MASHNPRQAEPNANNALGDLLKGMLPGCQWCAEPSVHGGKGRSKDAWSVA